MKHMTRKSMLYKTGVEYGDYTMNHVQGCSHGCKYPCYAMMMAKRFGRVHSYEEWCDPVLVDNTLDLLDKEIPKLKNRIKSVQLCFTTDPFMYKQPEVCDMSIKAITKLNEEDIPCVVLTKGVLPENLSGLSKENSYGITLVSLDERYRKTFEPNTSPYDIRLSSLKKLHDEGCRTWVSMEPYPTPNLINQDLYEILDAVSFTDYIVFGRTNYNKTVSSYPEVKEWYNYQVIKVRDYCNKRVIGCHIKKGTWTPKA